MESSSEATALPAAPTFLSLYYTQYCGYCTLVRSAIDRLGLAVELRDTLSDRDALDELVRARGRRTVPVLRVEREGAVEWLPESRDIVTYLNSLAKSA